jgi:hypothetical protein
MRQNFAELSSCNPCLLLLSLAPTRVQPKLLVSSEQDASDRDAHGGGENHAIHKAKPERTLRRVRFLHGVHPKFIFSNRVAGPRPIGQGAGSPPPETRPLLAIRCRRRRRRYRQTIRAGPGRRIRRVPHPHSALRGRDCSRRRIG